MLRICGAISPSGPACYDRGVTRSARRLLGMTAAPVVAVAMLAGCTLLIPFDEVAATVDGAAPFLQETSTDKDVTPDVSVVEAGADARDASANPAACKANTDGKYCGGDQIVWPADRKDDLITCKSAAIASVRLCASGTGCISMRPGYPDECDECAKRADGTYCGRDLPGWDVKNANERVQCALGRKVANLLCTSCKSNGAASACQ